MAASGVPHTSCMYQNWQLLEAFTRTACMRCHQRLRMKITPDIARDKFWQKMSSRHVVWQTCHAALAAALSLAGCQTTGWQPEHSRALVQCGKGTSWWCGLSACTGSRAAQHRGVTAVQPANPQLLALALCLRGESRIDRQNVVHHVARWVLMLLRAP